MKLILTILLFLSLSANSTAYYIDNSGSDLNAGTSPATAWQTVAKVNASSFLPGDSILFFRNGTWNEKLIFPSSGSAGNPIIISSYGSGNKPIITAFQTQGGFTNVGNIWTATATNSVLSLNTVLIGGIIRAKGRYPNTGYLTFNTATSTQSQIIGTLTGTPDYTSAEIAVRNTHWVIAVSKVTSQSTGTLNISPAMPYAMNLGGNGYFFQNQAQLLDTLNEWSYDSTTKVLKVYAPGSPSVQISTIDTLCYVHNKNYITFDGISFMGANMNAMVIDTTRFVTVQNCLFNNLGSFGISAKHSPRLIIKKDTIQNSLNNAIYLSGVTVLNGCDSSLVDSNYLKNTGMLPGMGQTYGSYSGIYTTGLKGIISNNRLDSTGYIGAQFFGQNTLVKNNYITNYCLVKDDGGGIYTIVAGLSANTDSGSIIRSNIVLNGIGAAAGTTASDKPVAGVYLDLNSKLITVDSNTVSNSVRAALFLGTPITNYIYDNTCIDSIGVPFEVYSTASGLNIKRNIYYSQSASQPCYYMDDFNTTQSIDSNYYLRPLAETGKIKMVNTTYALSTWVTATGYDVNSSGSPTLVTSALPLFYYNPTLVDSVIALSQIYYDAKGVSRSSSITIHPFTSVILFTAITQLPVITGHTKSRGYKFIQR